MLRNLLALACLLAPDSAASLGLQAVVAEVRQAVEPATLSGSQQLELAEHFAPVLVFHRDEEFFPVSPLFPLELDSSASAGESEVRAKPSLAAVLGDVDTRTAAYRSFPLQRKAALAKVFFQAYPFSESGEQLVVVEYWFYHLQNTYRATGGIFPVRVDASHPNDMEHLFLVLRPRSVDLAGSTGLPRGADDYAVKTIYASAHHGTLPNNAYEFAPGQELTRPPRVLVELGSHALAVDIDVDGRFTPGVDSTWNGKFVWGIRDSGKTWARYDPSYMDPRREDSSVVFAHGRDADVSSQAQLEPASYRYRLEHATSVSSAFQEFDASSAELDEAFKVDVAWPKRLFGRSDGGPEKLFIPAEHENFGDPKQLEQGYARRERGLTFGYTNILYSATFVLGGRYAFVNNSKLVPDLMLEGQVLLTGEGNDYYEVSALGYYPIDTVTNFFVGGSLITDDIRFDKRQYDLLGGLEFRLSSFRFRVAYRSTGAVSRAAIDFRALYLLF